MSTGVKNRIQVRRGYSMGYDGSPIPSGNTGYSFDPNTTTWLGNSTLYEGEIGYEVDTGKFKIGRKDADTGNLISWENLDYGGGGGIGGLIAGSGIGLLDLVGQDDSLFSIIASGDNNLTIELKDISLLVDGAVGSYYELGLSDNLTDINNVTISGDLSAVSGDFSGGVNIGGNLTVSGSSISFDAATITLLNLTASSGNFTNALTVNGTGVSLEGHGHTWSDIDITNSDFCDDVGDCVNTQLIGSSGVQLIYASGNNTLRVALSGEALAQHEITDTGFIVRTGNNAYRGATISGGSNIAVSNGDGSSDQSTVVSLSGTVTGLTSVTATTFTGDLVGNASTVTTNANLTGDVISTGNETSIASGVIVDADINASAAIADTKLATIATVGKVANSATTADSENNSNTIVLRDGSGNFGAGTITANLSGNASTSDQVKTISSSSSAEHFLTFVDSNNSSATAETVYTASGIKYIPSTDTLIVGNLSGVAIDGVSNQTNTVKTVTQSIAGTYYLTFVDSDNNSPGTYEEVYTDAGIVYDPSTNALTLTGDITASGATVNNNLVVGGNLTVNGTTVTANVDNMIVKDPVIVLGRPSGVIADDTKDRGIEIVWSESSVAKTGFFGWDRSANEFIAARDVTIIDNTISNITYLDAKFNNIDGSVITAGSQFDGPGSGLTGHAASLSVGGADNLNNGSGGSLAYQSSADNTTFLDIGTSGQFLRVNNGATAPTWDTLSYEDIAETPTIGSGILTLGVSGSGLTGSASFDANQTGTSTFTVSSNATDQNTPSTIVSRDGSGNFSAGTITADLTGTASTATSATNINISSNSSTDTSTYLVIVGNNATGDQAPMIDPGLSYNANTNILTTTQYNGVKVSLGTEAVETSYGVNYNTDQKFSIISSGILLLGTHVDSTAAPFRISNDTVTHGIWSGTAIAANKGGTGQTSYAVGDILYANTTSTLAKLANVATGNVLLAGGVNTAPSWGKVGLTTHISGTLAVGNGGTGATTLTGVVIGNGASAFTATSSTTPYALLRVNDAGNAYEFSTVIDGGTP
jgi:hypothetical protein